MNGKKQNIRFSVSFKNSVLISSALLIAACQPPASSDERQINDNNTPVDSPLIIDADSVTMSPDYILNIKPSRYQPSLGLQGVIEPVQQSRFIAAQNLTVQKVLVTEGQWVEKGTPLLMVQRQSTVEKASTNKTNEVLAENTTNDNEQVSNKSSNVIKKEGAPIDSNNEVAANRPDDSNSIIANKTSTQTTNTPAPDNDQSSNNAMTNSNQTVINKNEVLITKIAQPIVIRASFSGRIGNLNVKAQEQVDARTSLLNLSDDRDLRFVATLPMQAESQLSVGQNVNFTTKALGEKFTGQVSKLTASDKPDKLLVHIHVVKNDASRDTLKLDMRVTGRVDYGQIEVGTIVPKRALHDVDLSVLHSPPYQSLTPLMANIWIIQQDQRLTRQPVEVINYDPDTDQYLIAGISNDSLICLADLPIASAGKKVVVS